MTLAKISHPSPHPPTRVGSYLLLNTIFHWLYGVVLPIVFCGKSIVTLVRSIVLLANPEARSMRYDTTPTRVGSYLLLNTIFHWLYGVVLPIVFCGKSIVTLVRSIVLLANPEARSMRYDTTQESLIDPII